MSKPRFLCTHREIAFRFNLHGTDEKVYTYQTPADWQALIDQEYPVRDIFYRVPRWRWVPKFLSNRYTWATRLILEKRIYIPEATSDDDL
jgi:hypothetical protein